MYSCIPTVIWHWSYQVMHRNWFYSHFAKIPFFKWRWKHSVMNVTLGKSHSCLFDLQMNMDIIHSSKLFNKAFLNLIWIEKCWTFAYLVFNPYNFISKSFVQMGQRSFTGKCSILHKNKDHGHSYKSSLPNSSLPIRPFLFKSHGNWGSQLSL